MGTASTKGSFFLARDENDDLSPHLLSGEENGEQSIHSVVDGDNKASSPSGRQTSCLRW